MIREAGKVASASQLSMLTLASSVLGSMLRMGETKLNRANDDEASSQGMWFARFF